MSSERAAHSWTSRFSLASRPCSVSLGANMFISQFQALPELQTERLRLRRMRLSDAEAIFDYAKFPRVAAYTAWPHHHSLSDTQQFLREWTAGYARGEVRDWALVRKDDDGMVGTGGFTRFDPVSGTGEIGYAINPRFWRQGLATEAVQRIVTWGFVFEDLRRIVAHCMPGNTASIRVLEKNGFHLDGVLRGALRREGISVNLCEFSLQRSDALGLELHMREGLPSDRAAVETITLQAFQHDPATGAPIEGVEPSELSMVRAFYDEDAISTIHVAEFDGTVVGYILYARGSSSSPQAHVEGLTIMGMHPLVQRRRWGTELLLWSVQRMRKCCDALIVLGHPNFYPKAGFRPVHELGLTFAIEAPPEVCMALRCTDNAPPQGALNYHPIVQRFF